MTFVGLAVSTLLLSLFGYFKGFIYGGWIYSRPFRESDVCGKVSAGSDCKPVDGVETRAACCQLHISMA